MEIWAELLRGFSADSSFLFRRQCYRRSWAMRFRCVPEGMGFSLVQRGHAFMRSSSLEAPIRLECGALVFRIRGFVFELASDLTTPARVDYTEWPSPADGLRAPVAKIVCGGYLFRTAPMSPLFDQIPPVFVIPARDVEANRPLRSAIQLFSAELDREELIPDAVRVPLVEVVLHYILRHWIDHQDPTAPWRMILNDRHLHRALTALHADVAREWTVEELARESGLSRAAFASRFKAAVGDTPAHYLARVRVQKAVGLLKATDRPLIQVAQEVGYSDAFAFSKAFKRIQGHSPTECRRAG